jgi:signal transduction histidine kinase
VLRDRAFEPAKLIQDLTSGVRLIAAQKPDLALQVSVDDRIPRRLVGDPDKIAQIVTNLMSNAVKFTERGFVSLVVTARDGATDPVILDVIVSDTGIGIPADRLPHIFEEYTQASSDIGRKYGGSGLGLAISRKLLLLFGSELRVTSTVGQGTTFSFTLPLKRAPEEI